MTETMNLLLYICILFLALVSSAGLFVGADPGHSDSAVHAESMLAEHQTAADAVARMTRLRELIEDDSFLNRLSDLIIECLSFESSHSRDFCEDVRYVDAVQTALLTASTKDSAPEEAVPEVSLQNSATYPNIFRNFLMTNKYVPCLQQSLLAVLMYLLYSPLLI
jgi:hypothetical protein